MIIIGIDPGIKGAICILKDGKILDVFDMPTMPVGKKISPKLMAHRFTMKSIGICIAENIPFSTPKD